MDGIALGEMIMDKSTLDMFAGMYHFAFGMIVGLLLGIIIAHLRHARIEDAERTDDD